MPLPSNVYDFLTINNFVVSDNVPENAHHELIGVREIKRTCSGWVLDEKIYITQAKAEELRRQAWKEGDPLLEAIESGLEKEKILAPIRGYVTREPTTEDGVPQALRVQKPVSEANNPTYGCE